MVELKSSHQGKTSFMEHSLKKISQPISLMETAVGNIREAIISGQLPLGSKLSEQRLADTLGISRSPVRDALAALQSEGLVKISPKRGSFVFTPDLKEVDDLCEHRCILEVASVRRAISENKAQLVKNMSDALAKMQAAIQKADTNSYTKADMAFHNALIQSGGNHSIASSYQRTIGPLMALRAHLFATMDSTISRSMEEHVALLSACKKEDIHAIETIIEEHSRHLVEAYRSSL